MADGRREDEMRPITALFADIVGSTGLGECLGPDEIKARREDSLADALVGPGYDGRT